MMKKQMIMVTLAALLASCNASEGESSKKESTATTEKKEVNTLPTLTPEEQAAGFKLLFNGKNTEGWHIFHKDSVTGWEIVDGILSTKGGNGDLVSNDEYESFELVFDWKLPKAGNSGVMYMMQDVPEVEETWHTGVEYQLIDAKNWPDSLHEPQKPAAAYDLYDPLSAPAKDAGEWNTGKIISNKGHIEHYLNGEKTADYIWNSDDFKKRVAKSKFKDKPFAKKLKGHIVLQDHGQAVAFRNVKIKPL
jgi:Domain of Unknown Function (DUF1080)